MWLLVFVQLLVLAFASDNLSPVCESTLSFNEIDDYFTAAVAEYNPKGDLTSQTADEIFRLNVDEYCRLAKEASVKDADIIVFPEYGLQPLFVYQLNRADIRPFLQKLPPLNSQADSCSQCSIPTDELVFTSLSNCARQNSIYIVANLMEIDPCVPGQKSSDGGVCPEDGAFHYNTNAVFDRTGRLIARYRKIHLFMEDSLQPPAQPDPVTFTTDFGVEFGLLTCFDVLFHDPAVAIHEQKSVSNFILTTAWIDMLPLHTAIQVHDGLARSLNSNLIVSGHHSPRSGQLGSGMYIGSGPIRYTYSPQSGSQLIISQVRKTPSNIASQVAGTEYQGKEEHFFLYEDLSSYAKKPLRQASEETVEELCHGQFCCSFRYLAKCSGTCIAYHMVVFSGHMHVAGNTVFQQVCVVSLEDVDPANIHSGDKDPLIFETLDISAHFDSRYVFPRGGSRKMKLLPYSFRTVPGDNYAQWQSVTDMDNILVAGLYGRVYERDNSLP